MMNQQLQWIVDLLEQHEIEYWVDSGSLLGIVRDGDLIDSDHDIDISMRYSEKDGLENLLPEIKSNGYTVRPKIYEGEICTYLCHAEQDAYRHLDIKFFKETDNHFWTYSNKSLEGNGVLWWLSEKYYWAWKQFFNIKRYPSKPIAIHQLCTWWYPKELIEPIQFEDKFGVNVPANLESYLEYRFGDWRSPTDDWDYIRDDGSLITEHPREVVKETFRSKG